MGATKIFSEYIKPRATMTQPILLSAAAAASQAWSLGDLKPGKFVSTAQLCYEGKKAPLLQLAPSTQIDEVQTLFAPNVFRGTGDEPKKGIVFSIPDQVAQDIQTMEEMARDLLRPSCPQIDAMWHSCLRYQSSFRPSFRPRSGSRASAPASSSPPRAIR